MPEALKPCPFCGGEAMEQNNAKAGKKRRVWIVCKSCLAQTNDWDTLPIARQAWNQRV